MSRKCPITNSRVIYMACTECEEKLCRNNEIEKLLKRANEDKYEITKFEAEMLYILGYRLDTESAEWEKED